MNTHTLNYMKRLALFLAVMCLALGAIAQGDDGYVPQGFNFVGVSYKTFSVSDTKKVHFSRGNLQYNAVQNKWRFAPRQYNYICADNNNVSQTYDGWIDLFGWGTSGWNSGADAYQPWSTSMTNSDYAPGGAITNGLLGDYANADWGVYNRITNGGNKAGMWRTLTYDEWSYLIGNSSARQNKWALATIGGVYKGMMILPDEWTLPDGLSFTPRYPNIYKTNVYSIDEWQRMEEAGAVFLPAAGDRVGTSISSVNKFGIYWASTAEDETFANCIYFTTGNVYTGMSDPDVGRSVRLVRDSRESRGEAFDEDGASYKRFSVSATSTVRFSKGNLQYHAVQNIWRFAGKQYMCVGEGNANIAQNYNGWIDLFGWGTSGWNSGASAYQPWSTSTADADYYPGGGATNNNLTGDYAEADWGVHNRINNGGNRTRMWRTLTKDEWQYLLGDNTTRSGKWGRATIRGTSSSYTGLVLLPDDWSLPSGVTFIAGYSSNGYNTNSYTTEQWQKMESAGAIFLPAAGGRSDGTNIDDEPVWQFGDYWSSSYNSDDDIYGVGYGVGFSSLSINTAGTYYTYNGYSVRLVRD